MRSSTILSRRTLLRALLLAAALLPSTGFSQAWPSRPITLIVPYTPGTGPDILARAIGQRLGERLGQNVVVDNKPGASGNIGADLVAKAPPNGYTLMLTVNTFVITPALFRSLPYDPIADFTTIGKVAEGNVALVVNPQVLPVKTLDELVAYVRARPGKINYGSPGNGTPQHLAVELLKQRLGLDLVHVPYKGAAGANADLLAGQIQLMVLPVHTAQPFAKAGRLNVIAVSGENRSVIAPDSPSFAELGLKNLAIDLYFWMAGPAGLPREIVTRLNQEVNAIMASAEIREGMLKQGLVASIGAPEEIAAVIKADIERWKKFIADTKIRAD